MLELTDSVSLAAALADPDLDEDLRALLSGLAPHPAGLRGLRVFVVEGGDTAEVINRALGRAFTGEGAVEPAYDWIEDHGGWFEVSLDAGVRLLVEGGPATELGVSYLCLAHFWTDADELGE